VTDVLAIGDRAYSSWSLRGWLAFAAFGLPVETVLAPMDDPAFAATLAAFAPARTVPALRTVRPEGEVVLWDTLAIAETLAERHPELAFWPAEPRARGLARALAAEMHAGFAALRQACPMDLRTGYAGFAPGAAVRGDLARIETLWAAARALAAGEGPWLFGAYSLADVFFAPVATRIATYDLPMGPAARAYVAAHLAHPAFRAWRAAALADPHRLPTAGDGLRERPWPG
jgi:glutathione S-transferase